VFAPTAARMSFNVTSAGTVSFCSGHQKTSHFNAETIQFSDKIASGIQMLTMS
jgi:hypothetical protein